jgi:DNA-binding HxlR family transcriptional regulator
MVKSKFKSVSQLSCQEKLRAVDDSIYVIGGKWKLPVLIALSQGHNRFNDLRRTVTGISSKVLSNELKELELNGFLKRKIQADVWPVTTTYELTEYTKSLKDVIYALINWGVEHRSQIAKIRLREEK